MARLERMVIHCTDTPSRLEVSKDDLIHWHMAPVNLPNGRVKYKGKIYPSREALPDDKIKGYSIKVLNGRGWDRVGYSDMIHRNGEVENLTKYDEDEWVTNAEMTWGASGINSSSRHIVLVGGMDGLRTDDFFDNFTEEQFLALRGEVIEFLANHPDAEIAGHYCYSRKHCPSFDVKEFLSLMSLGGYFDYGKYGKI